jgi:CRP/FNR family transcriptional regulator, cyclic AMP receptor protein
MRLEDIFRSSEPTTSFKAGHVIFKEGEPGDFMYVLVEGQVEVVVRDVVVGAFEPVEVFGEMAVIDPKPRSASVVAKTNCRLIAINQKRFMFLIQQKPQFAIDLMKILVERIRWMDTRSKAQQAQQA